MALVFAALLMTPCAHGQDWPTALQLTPGSVPAPMSFYFPGGDGPLARSTSRADRGYAVSYLPVVRGGQYAVLLCCGVALNGVNLYALDVPPPQAPGMKQQLNLSSVQLATDAYGGTATGAMARFQLPADSALPQLFLLTESPSATAVDESPTLSVEVYGLGPGFPLQRIRGGWWIAAGAGASLGSLSRGRSQMLMTPVTLPGPGW